MQGINSLYYSTTMRPRMARGGITSIRQPYGFGSFVKKFVGKATKPVAKILDKIIPNEIKPALPYLAAVAPFIIPPQFAFASQGIFSNPAISRALLSGGLSLGSQMAQEGYDPDNPNLIGPLLSAGSAYLATPGTAESIRGMQTIPSPGDTGLAGGELGILDQAKNLGLEGLAKTSDVLAGGTEKFATEGLKGIISKPFAQAAAIPLTTQTTSDAIAFAKQAQLDYEKQLAEYNQMLEDQGLAKEANDQDRAKAIYNSMMNAGAFTTDTIRETLDQLGLPSGFFAGGGIVGSRKGYKLGALVNLGKTVQKGYGKLKNFLARMSDDVAIETRSDYADDTGASLDIFLTPKSKKGKKGLDELVAEGSVIKDGDTYIVKDSEEFMGGAIEKDLKASGVDEEGLGYKSFKEGAGESEYGVPYYGYDSIIEAFNRPKKAEGGLMNLRTGGMPAEIDARQSGGFIPIGKAEKADDVPARLSQNEFVMTADAVRGMGQGDINLGAQRMYNIMKQYEPIGKALV
jgi:hypothetical protein